jgi:carbamoyltransferase
MRVLGVHDGHNAAAALVVDGEIVGAVQEERFTREKNWSGVPVRSIEWVLRQGGLQPADVDAVAMNGDHMPTPKNREELLAEYREVDSAKVRARRLAGSIGPVRRAYEARRRDERRRAIEAAGFPASKMRFVDHHVAHAAAAYYGYGRYDEPVLVLTNDGAGDGLCATVSVGRDGRLERIAAVPEAESIGNVYAVVTFMLGMVPLEHEYKLMGLAPYASRSAAEAVLADLDGLMRVDGMTWARARRFPPTYYSYSALRELFEYRRFDAICAGLQLWVERMLVDWAHSSIRATGIRKLALSGGTFMNVKVNKLLAESPEVDDLFVFPSCGDESNSIGAAYAVEAEHGNPRVPALRDLYLGPEATDEEIEREVPTGMSVERPEDMERSIAELLARGEIVGRFAGRAEFGARALGNRSILADASRPDAVRVINDMIKSRDFWMPFAPAVLEERASDYLINPNGVAAPYMILSFDTTERRGELQAAIHANDHTARPQIVYESWNPSFHRILRQYEARTGRGGLLNTSFNLHGFPIVNSPADALDVLERSDLQYLALGPFLVTKAQTAVRAA